MSEDLLKTPIDDIINNRAKLMGLATNLFGRTSPSVIRAFGQFGRNPELARVIEAKRKGIFDYGACIVDTSAGVKWPTDTSKVLEAIDKAEKGEITVEDLTPLFSGNREAAEEAFSKVVLSDKKAKKTKSVESAVKESAKDPDNVLAFKTRETVKGTDKLIEEPKEAVVKPQTGELDQSVQREMLNLLGQGIVELREEALANFNKFGALLVTMGTNTSVIFGALEILLKNQEIINRNLMTIATCFGDVELENVAVGPQPEGGQKPTRAEIKYEAKPESKSISAPVEDVPPAQDPEPESTETAPVEDKEIEVTEALLATMDVDALIELCGKLGIKLTTKPGSKSYPTPLKNKIRIAVGLPT